MFGIDYATSVTSLKTLVDLRRGGVHFACRYVSTHGNPKNLTVDERKALQAAGLQIVVVFETTADRSLGGVVSGKLDAISAQAQVAALGMADAPVYFAVDFDASTKLVTVDEYFQGVVSVLGHDRVGSYGGLAITTYLADRNRCKYFWQTYAWSGGNWDGRSQIRQYKNGVRLYGIDCDYDQAVTPDFGQWPRPKPPAKPKPAPPPIATQSPPAAPPTLPDPTARKGWPVWAYYFAAWLRRLFH